MATRSRMLDSTSTGIRLYDRDVSAALNIRRIAAGPGRPRELSSWLGRPAMPNPGRPSQEWVEVRGKGLLRNLHAKGLDVIQSLDGWASTDLLRYLRPVDKSWQPSDFLPDSSSPDFLDMVGEMRQASAQLPYDYLVALVGDMVTEEALPSYMNMLNTLDGTRDETGAEPHGWATWTRHWTAEENRHGDLLNKYLYLTGSRVDMQAVESTIQRLIGSGLDPQLENNPYLCFVYTSFQAGACASAEDIEGRCHPGGQQAERATKISHGNTARLAKHYNDDLLTRICGIIAADEGRHETAYTAIVEQLFKRDPEGALLAFADMMKKGIVMPAHFVDDGVHTANNAPKGNLFLDYAAVADSIGVYTTTDYANIVEHLVKRWGVAELSGLSGPAATAQEYLMAQPQRVHRLAAIQAERRLRDRRRGKQRSASFSWIRGRQVALQAVPEDPDFDIDDRDEAGQPVLTEAERKRKASGEARAARSRVNTFHARKAKLAHLTGHLPQALWDAFLERAVRPRVKAISERGVIGSLLLGFLVRGLFTLHTADQLEAQGQPLSYTDTDISVSAADIPNLSCRNPFLQLCRGLPGEGENTRPSAAVAAVLAAHPDLCARLEAIPRNLSDTNMVDNVLLGTNEHQRRFGVRGLAGGHLPAWSKRQCTYVRRMVCGLEVTWLLREGGVVVTAAMQAEVALQRGLLGLGEGEKVDQDWVEDPANRGRLLRHAVHTTREMEAAMAVWQLDMVPWEQSQPTNLLTRPPRPPTPYARRPHFPTSRSAQSPAMLVEAKQEFSLFLYTSGTPFARADNPHLKRMFQLLGMPDSPTAKQVRTSYLSSTYSRLKKRVEVVVEQLLLVSATLTQRNWSAWGRTFADAHRNTLSIEKAEELVFIQANDELTNSNQRDQEKELAIELYYGEHCLAWCVAGSQETFMLDCVHTEADSVTAVYIANMFDEVISKHNLVGKACAFVTDTPSTNKAAWRLVEQRHPKVLSVGCWMHILDLYLHGTPVAIALSWLKRQQELQQEEHCQAWMAGSRELLAEAIPLFKARWRYGDSQVLYLAAILDPRYKMLDFQFSPAQFSQAEQALSRLVTVDDSQADQSVAMALEQLRRGWGAPPSELLSRTQLSPIHFAPHLTAHPLKWWAERGGFAPLLQAAAQRVLCSPATAAANERVFSSFKHIWSDKRSSLLLGRMWLLAFIYFNKRVLERRPKPQPEAEWQQFAQWMQHMPVEA
ncbi:hypothetical protein QJQ45_008717 [Haematococcus lacustris]|nr:hypothetical protein QJQ45_008717 [Haematococcus lacustris]